MCSARSGYYIGDEKQERRIHTERREKLKEDQRKTKAEDKRKPMERILAKLEAKRKKKLSRAPDINDLMLQSSTSNPSEI